MTAAAGLDIPAGHLATMKIVTEDADPIVVCTASSDRHVTADDKPQK